jgi:hypothetical protein
MKALNRETGNRLAVYALALGIGYAGIALAEVIENPDVFPGGVLSVAVLLVVSATYLMGIRDLKSGRREGLSFLMGGLILSAAVGGLYLLMTCADAVMYLLGETDEFLNLADISPATVLLILALPLLPILKSLTKGMAW